MSLLVTNDMDTPIHFKASDILGTIESDNYFDSHPPTDTSHTQSFFNLVTPILQSKENEDQPSTDIKYSINVMEWVFDNLNFCYINMFGLIFVSY